MRVWFGLLALATTCLAVSGCGKRGDCELYNTCPGDLTDLAVQKLEPEAAEECRDCLERKCEREDNACSSDWKCNLTARCRMTSTPSDYQDCIRDLHRH